MPTPLNGKLFKASDNVEVAMKGMNYPISIRQISHCSLALLRMPAAFQPRLVDIPYQFIRIVGVLPATRSSP